ncbi:MAG: aspartate/glutamate racemase family protein [Thermoflexales bacterium]
MSLPPELTNPAGLFSDYLRVTGVAHTGPEKAGDPALIGKRLGLINGSSWVTLWSTYFGRRYVPGAHLINVGNEAVQVNFMDAHRRGLACPPQANIDAFVRYGLDLAQLAHVDAILLTCSTMNRAFGQVQQALAPYRVPVIQIDQPMMERAISCGPRALVIATHGPTVSSTQSLLGETAAAGGMKMDFEGLTLESAWYRLAEGDIQGHNEILAEAIRSATSRSSFDCVVLAQLSMSVFNLSYPDASSAFGLPVLTSAECGFARVREVLSAAPARNSLESRS